MDNYNNMPGGTGPTNEGLARDQVSTPAIMLMVTGGLGIVLGLFGLLRGLVSRGDALPPQVLNDPNMQQFVPFIQKMQSTGWVTNVLVLGLSAVTLVGALKMKNLESYSLAMAASIIAMVPCLGPCCCLGLPVGIWALIVLNKPEVKSSFRG